MKSLLKLLIFLSIIPIILGNEIIIEQYLNEDFTTKNNISIISKSVDTILTFNKQLFNLTVDQKEKINCDIFEKNSIICKVKNQNDLPILYKIYVETEKIVNENKEYELKILTSARSFNLIVYLPIGYVLEEEMGKIKNLVNASSDGKRIILHFRDSNITVFETKFKIKEVERIIPFPYSLITIILTIFLAGIVIVYFYYKSKLEKQRLELMKILEPKEKNILEILLKNNPINQKKLVELTQLSKAEISKIVYSLKNRGIVDVEKRGRNNIIYLKKKI